MTEKLFQFIWLYQNFNKQALTTTDGEPVLVQYPGIWNHNQGPDFLKAKVTIGKTQWAGSIELHLKTSDWLLHQHHGDPNYSNVVLHVVYEHDVELLQSFPTLVLQNRIAKQVLERYNGLMQQQQFIPCQQMISKVPEITMALWKERLLVERLQEKATKVIQLFEEQKQHWEACFWILLAKNFGLKVNQDAFEAMAKSLPITILAKHKNQIQTLEALLLGQCNALDEIPESDSYAKMLQKEYLFYKKKYQLTAIPHTLQFLRMRPANFPTVRLAQLAMLINNSSHLFSKIKEATNIKELKDLLNVTPNDYWHYHYTLDEVSEYKVKKLGATMVDSIIINTVAVVLFAYGYYNHQEAYKLKALKWLEQTATEKNAIVDGFMALQLPVKSAYDSQAFIQLKNKYCQSKRCLECAVGNKLLKTI